MSALEMFAQMEAVAYDLAQQKWIFAKTMPENPHEYTLRKLWQHDKNFVRAVKFIRKYGYVYRFRGRPYIQFDINEHFYWTMGDPIDKTILINRKRIEREDPYDKIAEVYDDIFEADDPVFLAENEEVMSWLGDLNGNSVLDVGCGTGLLLDYLDPQRYVGIDPSRGMLDRLKAKHPDRSRQTVCCPLRSYSGNQRFDVVVALFGTASYLTDEEIERIPTMLNPGGRYLLMFYQDDYNVVTYEKTGVTVNHCKYRRLIPGEETMWHHYIVVDGTVE